MHVTYARMALYRYVHPMMLAQEMHDHDEMLVNAEVEMLRRGVVQKGDTVVFIFGDEVGIVGGTNSMKIVKVGERKGA